MTWVCLGIAWLVGGCGPGVLLVVDSTWRDQLGNSTTSLTCIRTWTFLEFFWTSQRYPLSELSKSVWHEILKPQICLIFQKFFKNWIYTKDISRNAVHNCLNLTCFSSFKQNLSVFTVSPLSNSIDPGDPVFNMSVPYFVWFAEFQSTPGFVW